MTPEPIEEKIEQKINHSWDGRLFAFQDNAMVYVDVTDEVEDHITSEKQISYRQGRIEVAEDIKATAENEIDLSKSVDFNKPLYNVIERCNALITNQSKEKE